MAGFNRGAFSIERSAGTYGALAVNYNLITDQGLTPIVLLPCPCVQLGAISWPFGAITYNPAPLVPLETHKRMPVP